MISLTSALSMLRLVGVGEVVFGSLSSVLTLGVLFVVVSVFFFGVRSIRLGDAVLRTLSLALSFVFGEACFACLVPRGMGMGLGGNLGTVSPFLSFDLGDRKSVV